MSGRDERSRRAGQYLRVSLDRSGHARSVSEQQRDNERAAEANGWAITLTYAEPNRSASRYATRARENYQRLLSDIDAGRLDVLILWEPSRGSRKVSEWVELIELAERRGVDIYVTSHSRLYEPGRPRDRRSLLEDAVDSEYESGKVSDRVKRSTAASAEAGRPFGSIPFGFRRIYEVGSASPVKQVPCPETAPIVREIVARVLAGESLHGIAVDLNRRGVPTPQMVRDARLNRQGVQRGGWNNPKLRKLLGSPTMAGWRVHQGQRYGQADWEPLVSAADHAAVQVILNDPARRTQRGTAPKYLLSGVGECGECGGWLRYFSNRGFPSYGCAGRNNTNPGCVSRRQAPLDAYVVGHVVRRLADPELLTAIARSSTVDEDAAAQAAGRVAHLRAQIEQYERQATEVTGMAAASFLRVITDLCGQLEAAEAEVATVRRLPTVVVELARPDAAELWNSPRVQGDIELQRRVVRALFRVIVHRSTRGRGQRGFDPTSIEIVDR